MRSMSILSFLKQSKKPEPTVVSEPVNEEPVAPAAEPPSESPLDLLSPSPSLSLASLRSSFLETMQRSETDASTRRSALREKIRRLLSRREVALETTSANHVTSLANNAITSSNNAISQSNNAINSSNNATSTSHNTTNSSSPPEEEEALIEVANEFDSPEEATLLDATPAMVSAPQRAIELTVEKNSLTAAELPQLTSLLGFRYLEADSDMAPRSVFFGISHKQSEKVTGRHPLARDDRVDYDAESESEELTEEDVPGDDCNDTESESGESEEANRLDYGDGFLAEEDLNIGDGNLTAEEKSALVFRSVSGNKGKLTRETRLPNVPIVVSARNSGEFGVDLQRCRCVINDPVFFERQIEALRSRPIELVAGETEDGVSETPEKRAAVKRLNMNEEMVQVLSALIQGQAITITQINDKMQERFPGLPKRQVEMMAEGEW